MFLDVKVIILVNSKIVSASSAKHPDDRIKWIDSMPNDRRSLEELKEIHVCVSHFNCDWVTVQGGGKRPIDPPSIFPGVPKSSTKQTVPRTRTTKSTSADTRIAKQKHVEDTKDKINSFASFSIEIKKRYKQYSIVQEESDLYLSLTDRIGQHVVHFFHFRKVSSSFGFLHLVNVEKYGFKVNKTLLPLQKNGLLSRWSQLEKIISLTNTFEPANEDILLGLLIR